MPSSFLKDVGIISKPNLLDNFIKNGTKTVAPGIMKKGIPTPIIFRTS